MAVFFASSVAYDSGVVSVFSVASASASGSSYRSSGSSYSSNNTYDTSGYSGTSSAPAVASEPKVIYETKYETKHEAKHIEKKKQLNHKEVKGICRVADDKIDWFEILSSRKPTDKLFNKEAWEYLHSVALKVCQGDVDTYLKVITHFSHNQARRIVWI